MLVSADETCCYPLQPILVRLDYVHRRDREPARFEPFTHSVLCGCRGLRRSCRRRWWKVVVSGQDLVSICVCFVSGGFRRGDNQSAERWEGIHWANIFACNCPMTLICTKHRRETVLSRDSETHERGWTIPGGRLCRRHVHRQRVDQHTFSSERRPHDIRSRQERPARLNSNMSRGNFGAARTFRRGAGVTPPPPPLTSPTAPTLFCINDTIADGKIPTRSNSGGKLREIIAEEHSPRGGASSPGGEGDGSSPWRLPDHS